MALVLWPSDGSQGQGRLVVSAENIVCFHNIDGFWSHTHTHNYQCTHCWYDTCSDHVQKILNNYLTHTHASGLLSFWGFFNTVLSRNLLCHILPNTFLRINHPMGLPFTSNFAFAVIRKCVSMLLKVKRLFSQATDTVIPAHYEVQIKYCRLNEITSP